ncbi:aminodeoxychorismate synthase component I [Microvirga tunisiensis]|uniref:aminodeoxychorismate synthase n=1 Tax=Microvirga tunisiensis TaxID=2108360 RepID=A0A5N7MM29_9HYPH|nr:aminodeoxychorismate synthase component I [Microvirga tunisiensis]MPR08994.1 aminodeoxychorismate synthase component I [Microvirga tunisiensis]MPR27194.1 aminodeoxychorismate synthase component I [Microvirga tunisiensis]
MRHPTHLEHLGSLDAFTCVQTLSHLPDVLFLDSALRHPGLGRYSFVAADPFGRFVVRGGRAFWNGDPLPQSPLSALRCLLDRYCQSRVDSLPPFQGGAAGYLAYDFRHTFERLTPAPADYPCPEAVLAFYDVVASFDHRSGDAWLVSTGWPEQDPDRRQKRAIARAQYFRGLLSHGPCPLRDCKLASRWTSNFSASGYGEAVKAVIESILAGDIFQANIAQRFIAHISNDFDALAFYRQLRRVNPATFGAFLDFDEMTIASSSPERFVKVDRGCVETRPIKGTASRSSDQQRDQNLAEALLCSEKDRAENLMIVDLLRNDLSRVCRPHTVRTPVLCDLESYAAVHHLVSAVEGQLHRGATATDVIAACFPGGSITGAPKIRAMEIITQIERCARQVYCGSIGYFGFDGTTDMNIAIRTVMLKDGSAVFHAGGGITALSDPQAEYQETLAKAQRLFAAFEA